MNMSEKAHCARCGLESTRGELTTKGVCPYPPENVMACRDRELANLHSLLRSVTGKLENVAALLESPMGVGDEAAARALIDSVLEVLS